MADLVKASTATAKAGRPANLSNEPESPEVVSSQNVLQTEHPPVGTRSPRSIAEAAVIVVLGQTGSGKSYFIQAATQDKAIVAGHTLSSETAEICAYKTEIDGNPVVLVDTIGFDDSYRSDATVLREVATWLAERYAEGTRMAGILYMQNIDAWRITGSVVRNLRAFEKINGADAMESTILVANRWDKIDRDSGERRLEELMENPDFWGTAIEQGATVERYLGTHEDAQRIQELIDRRLELSETEAGKTLLEEINQLKALHMREMSELRSTMREALDSKNQEFYKALAWHQSYLQRLLESSEAEMLELKSKNKALEESRSAYDERIARLEGSFEDRLRLIEEQGLPPPPPYPELEGQAGSRGSFPSYMMAWMSVESSWGRATVQFFRKLLRPRLRAGYRRLEWKCTCGELLYGDFQETTSGSLDKLAASLKEYSEQGSRQGEPSQLQTPTKPYTRQRFSGRGNSPGRNRDDPNQSNQESGTNSSNQLAHPIQIRQALQLCIETGKYTLALNEVDLHGPCTDGNLFGRIRERYELSSRHILPLRMWFWKPENAIFVKFRLGQLPFVSPIAGTIDSPVIPPKEEVDAGKYVYTPCPIEEIPMYSRTFFHHFYSPASKHPYAFWGMRLPRKLGPKLGPMTQGWEIHLEERPDWSLFTLLMFILLLLSGLIAGLYSWRTGDHQSGIAIGTWLTSVQAMGITALCLWWK
ncbi:uncharacterized protein FMAN_14509 [Fusarium mangiferae]|uniref:G domain-containing protein n=1 Tax=Fusarium mangiferae TaxID=192010 RepID=A0A1L7UEL6_FUSMA|nr:uncharacterized protein FMAN_14509 [Fusarium mangiferae]CVL07632.1 uncharacterized protein FMAN_14509 [Fusarium mangiferae]